MIVFLIPTFLLGIKMYVIPLIYNNEKLNLIINKIIIICNNEVK